MKKLFVNVIVDSMELLFCFWLSVGVGSLPIREPKSIVDGESNDKYMAFS